VKLGDATLDRRVARLLGFLLLALVLTELAWGAARDRAWPFVTWPMYARVRPEPPDRIEEVEIRVVSRERGVERAAPSALFTHVHAALGRRVAEAAFEPGPHRGRYREVLLRRLRHLLPRREIVEIQARRIVWRLDPRVNPAFDASSVDQVEELGSFSPQEVEGSGR